MVSGQAIKVNTPGMKISIKSKIARRIHIAESRSDNQFRYIKNKIARRIHILIGDYILTYKKADSGHLIVTKIGLSSFINHPN